MTAHGSVNWTPIQLLIMSATLAKGVVTHKYQCLLSLQGLNTASDYVIGHHAWL